MVESTFIGVFIFLLGTIVGSFLNVCIVRMPEEKSVAFPPSHCPECKKHIPWYDNIPILSYLALKGKCRFCSAPFSIRYMFVEILTGITFVLFYLYYGVDVVLIPYLFMVSCFIVATFIDFGHRIIPNEISVGGMWFGLLFSLLIPAMHDVSTDLLSTGRIIMQIIISICMAAHILYIFFSKEPMDNEDRIVILIVALFFFADLIIGKYLGLLKGTSYEWLQPYLLSLDASLLGLLVGGGVIYAMGLLGDFLFKKESMGGGDIKLLAMIGAFLGWKYALLIFFIAPIFGAIYGLIEKVRVNDTAIAYGPFLVLASLICLFKGDLIIHWILSGYGLH